MTNQQLDRQADTRSAQLRQSIKQRTGFCDEEVDYEVQRRQSMWPWISEEQALLETAEYYGAEVVE